MPEVLVAGGLKDPNLEALAAFARRSGVEVCDLRLLEDAPARVVWNIGTGTLLLDGREISGCRIRPS